MSMGAAIASINGRFSTENDYKNAKPLFSQLTTASHHYKTSFDIAIVEIHAVVS